jgi:small subunit ribosomal protein S1
MADLLASSQYKIPTLKRGQEVTGKVVLATGSEILVDIGAKSEGIISGREISSARDLIANINVGDSIEATVLYPENDAGQVVLSLRKLSGEKRWQELEERKNSGDEVEVVAMEANRGGVICDFAGLRGFLPSSQLAKSPSRLDDLIGKNLSVHVIEVDRPTNRLIFSQKRLGKKDVGDLLALLAKVKIGDKHQGVVTAILPFGIFVEIEIPVKESGKAKKLEGLVHISEISWEKVDDLPKIFKIGDKVDVMVIAKDSSTGRLNLSIKQLVRDPFTQASEKYSKEMRVKGTVSRITQYGIFVTLEDGVEGLVHISKIPPNVAYKEGESIECEIDSIDVSARRIALVPVVLEKPVLYR